MASNGTEEISILEHVISAARLSTTPIYKIVVAGDPNYLPEIINGPDVTLSTPDGMQVTTQPFTLEQSDKGLDATGHVTYDNFIETDTPEKILSGHQSQLPVGPNQQQADGSFTQDYYQYVYETIGVPAGSGTGSGGGTPVVPMFDSGPTPIVSDAGLGVGSIPDPANVADIAVPVGSDLFVDNGQVYEITGGQTQGFVEVVDSTGVPSPGFVDISGNTPSQVVVDAVAVDPETSATVAVDYVVSDAVNVPITAVPDIPSDTGHAGRDAYASTWDNGGGIAIANGDPTSFIDLLTPNRPGLAHIYQTFQDLTGGDIPSFILNNQTDDQVRNQTTDFENAIRGPLSDIIKDGITNTLNLKERVDNFKSIKNVIYNYVDGLLNDVKSGVTQLSAPSTEAAYLCAAITAPPVAIEAFPQDHAEQASATNSATIVMNHTTAYSV